MRWTIYNSTSEEESCSNTKKYNDNSTYIETCCARSFKNTLRCIDGGNNGWEGGYLTINGKMYCTNSEWSKNAVENTNHLDLEGTMLMAIYSFECSINFIIKICKVEIFIKLTFL